MQNDEIKVSQTKAIRFDQDLLNEIEELRKGTERTFSQQVRLMLKKYIEIAKK